MQRSPTVVQARRRKRKSTSEQQRPLSRAGSNYANLTDDGNFDFASPRSKTHVDVVAHATIRHSRLGDKRKRSTLAAPATKGSSRTVKETPLSKASRLQGTKTPREVTRSSSPPTNASAGKSPLSAVTSVGSAVANMARGVANKFVQMASPSRKKESQQSPGFRLRRTPTGMDSLAKLHTKTTTTQSKREASIDLCDSDDDTVVEDKPETVNAKRDPSPSIRDDLEQVMDRLSPSMERGGKHSPPSDHSTHSQPLASEPAALTPRSLEENNRKPRRNGTSQLTRRHPPPPSSCTTETNQLPVDKKRRKVSSETTEDDTLDKGDDVDLSPWDPAPSPNQVKQPQQASIEIRNLAEAMEDMPVTALDIDSTLRKDKPTMPSKEEQNNTKRPATTNARGRLSFTKANRTLPPKRRKHAKIQPGATLIKLHTQTTDLSESPLHKHSSPDVGKQSQRVFSESPTHTQPSKRCADEPLDLLQIQSPSSTTNGLGSPKRKLRKSFQARRRSARIERRHTAPETIELSSDSEIEDQEEQPQWEVDLVRIAVGMKVKPIECRAQFCPNALRLILTFATSRRGSNRQTMELVLEEESLQEFAFYNSTEMQESSDEDSTPRVDGRGLFSFVAFQFRPNADIKLISKNNWHRRELNEWPYLLLEFRNPEEMVELASFCLEQFDSSEVQLTRLTGETVSGAGKSLIEHSCKSKRSNSRSAFLSGRQKDSTLLVFPFGADKQEIKAAAGGLTEANGKMTPGVDECSDKKETQMVVNNDVTADNIPDDATQPKQARRAHYVTIRVEDFERLNPGEWLNDSLVDLWMQWISREDAGLASEVHFFTSHFFTTLFTDGPEAVASWTARKNIRIFDKKLIFIPINKDYHWSLMVVVNPGAIDFTTNKTATKEDPISCMIFMDSLRMHNPTIVSGRVRKWLNHEWNRMHPSASGVPEAPFENPEFRNFRPKVPRQNNSWDCGVFVCRYAFAIYQLRHRTFAYEDAGMHGSEDSRKAKQFYQLITKGAEFDFRMEDIARFREEFKVLIERLSETFQKHKKSERDLRLQRKPIDGDNKEVTDKPANASTDFNNVDKECQTDPPEKKGTPSKGLVSSNRGTTAGSTGKENQLDGTACSPWKLPVGVCSSQVRLEDDSDVNEEIL